MTEEKIDLALKKIDIDLNDDGSDTKTASKKKPPKKKHLTKLQELKQEIVELNDKNLRQLAEFENYKKRSMRETERAMQRTGDNAIASFLPLLDDIHRTLLSAREHNASASFIEGIELIKDNFEKILEDKGVSVIETVGVEFDPDFHEAVMIEGDSKQDNNTVLEEFEKGYKHNDRVLRHAKVKVNRI